MKWKCSKGFWIVWTIYIALFLADLFTTWLNRDLLHHLEVNPIFPHVGLWGISALNLLVIWVLWRSYKKYGVNYRYLIINFMVSSAFVRCIAIKNALDWYFKDNAVVAAAAVTQELRTQTLMTVGVLGYLPIALGIISYLFWQLDHKSFRKDGKI